MKTLVLSRLFESDAGTFGLLSDSSAGMICLMLELPWRNNMRSKSCIPAGEYRVEYLPVSGSGKYRDVYHVIGVQDRSGILMHKGNLAGDRDKGLVSHSWGCLLPCTRFGKLRNQDAGLGSAAALASIHKAAGRQAFNLEILPCST